MVSPTSKLRMVISDGRTRPMMAQRMKTGTGEAVPVRNSTISSVARIT